MKRKEIRFAGFGGQGIILAGLITARAITLFDKKESVFTQSYGPEARGGACSAGIVVDEKGVDYPYVLKPDVLVVMSKEAFKTYVPKMNPRGILIVDKDIVKVTKNHLPPKVRVFKIPATRLAEELGNRIAANIIMLGYFTKVTGLVSPEGMKESIKTLVPPKFIELNLKAYEVGYEYGNEGGK